MSKCTEDALKLFGKDHYTYINQIFGDVTVRQIIKEVYAPRDWNFVAIPQTEGRFRGSYHHVLEKKGKNGEIIQWCSVEEGFQVDINENDTLCQSYTLLKYLNKPIDKNEYFTGVPSPAAAGLILLPLFIYFEFPIINIKNEYLNLFNTLIVGFLMISKIPTISIKKINFNKKYNTWLFLLSVVVFISLISNLWLTLIVLFILYIFSIFFTIYRNRKF